MAALVRGGTRAGGRALRAAARGGLGAPGVGGRALLLGARAGPGKDVGGKEADEFLGGVVGQFVSGLTEFATNSPLNQGKIMLAKAQAGDYDVAATQAELQGIIDGSPVVMFSFTT